MHVVRRYIGRLFVTGVSMTWITRPVTEMATYEAAGWIVDSLVTIRPENALLPRGASGRDKINAAVLYRPRIDDHYHFSRPTHPAAREGEER